MTVEGSSRDVSISYFIVLLAGFSVWVAYGMAAGNMVLVVPNGVALLVGAALVIIALRLRRSRPDAVTSPPPAGR